MSLWDRLMTFFHISRKRAVPYAAPAIVAPTLATLGLSSASFTVGTTASGTITGATLASVLSISGAPTGFTINSAARTWSYDGTGSSTSGNLTLTEVLAGAIGSPKPTAIAYVVSPPSTITAPVLAQTSAAGTAPFTWTTVVNEDNTFPGYIFHLQQAAGLTPSKNSDGSYVTPVQDIRHLYTQQELETGDIDLTGDGFATWQGAGSIQMRIERDDGVVSSWSNALSDTISGAVSVFSPTVGTGRNLHTALSDTNHTLTPSGGGVTYGGRANNPAGPTKFHVEWTIGTIYDSIALGIDDGTTDFGTGTPIPGNNNTNGIFLGGGAGSIDWCVGPTNVYGSVSGQHLATGDIVILEADRTAGTAQFYLKRGTAAAYAIGPLLTSYVRTNWYFYATSDSDCAFTINTGNATFAMTPSTGYQPYG